MLLAALVFSPAPQHHVPCSAQAPRIVALIKLLEPLRVSPRSSFRLHLVLASPLPPPLPSLPGRHKPPLALQTEDKEYDELEEKFQSMASSVTALKENVASYLQHLQVKLRLYAGSWPHPGLRTQSGGCRTPPRPLQTAAGGAQGFVFLS